MIKRFIATATATFALAFAINVAADEADRRQALFGDVHIHTQLSFDAYIFGIRRTPDDAYRYALGETLRHAAGYDIALKGGPLDFYAVTDHAEYLGVLPTMNDPASSMSSIASAEGMFSPVFTDIITAFGKVFQSVTDGKEIEDMKAPGIVKSGWQEVQAAADRYYRPGEFTTFAGFEFTSQPDYGNLHRVVLFRSSRRPELPFGAMDSTNPEDLWAWLDASRDEGMDGLAIPHNSNLSDGLMFQLTDFDGNPITSEYAQTRMRNEPIVEMTQVKGTSDTHPALSPNDEFAGFEIYETLLGTDITGKTQGSYVREALQNGLKIEEEIGVNPYKFGLIGASDSHNAGGPVEEDHFFGKTGLVDGTPDRRRAFVVPGEDDLTGAAASSFFQWSAAGLAGVWAERNNREDIFAAMRRKETFATSGPRIKVRLFAGYDYPEEIFERSDFATLAYSQGVPMGGDLSLESSRSPTFLAQASRDAHSAGLQRMQIIRGWVEEGELKEAIFNIACDNGSPDPSTHRCADNGAQIDVTSCEIPSGYGQTQFDVSWTDPDFDPNRRAFYYARVLENPTCRWSTWEANRQGKEVRDGLPLTILERAWSSPIWVKPQ